MRTIIKEAIRKDRLRSPSFVLMETYSGKSRSFSVPIRGCGLLGLVLDLRSLVSGLAVGFLPQDSVTGPVVSQGSGSPTAFIDVVLCHRANCNGCLLRSPATKESIHRLTYVIENPGREAVKSCHS